MTKHKQPKRPAGDRYPGLMMVGGLILVIVGYILMLWCSLFREGTLWAATCMPLWIAGVCLALSGAARFPWQH